VTKSKGAGKSARNGPTNGVLRVGDGRGFVVESRNIVHLGTVDRLAITAAHCLTAPLDHRYASTPEPPCLPAAHPARYTAEATYAKLLGPLGGECTVTAECLFVDPISDIAAFGAPDSQELEAVDAYHALVGGMTPLTIADPPAFRTEVVRRAKLAAGKDGVIRATNQTYAMKQRVPGVGTVQVLSLDGKKWIRAKAQRNERLQAPDRFFEGGMGRIFSSACGCAVPPVF
jgi:hypothetical protein